MVLMTPCRSKWSILKGLANGKVAKCTDGHVGGALVMVASMVTGRNRQVQHRVSTVADTEA